MAMQGSLSDMTVADLIQHNCQDRKTAQLTINHHHHQATLFFKEGAVSHAALGDKQGEEVIYTILEWQEGQFSLEVGVKAPLTSIHRSWSSLLLEGARRLDESRLVEEPVGAAENSHMEVNKMAQKLDVVLQELGEQVEGFIAAAVVGMDGFSVAQHAKGKKTDVDSINAQMTLLVKLVDSSLSKLGASVEDNLLTTANAYLLLRFLKDKSHFLGIVVDRKAGSLGNMRLMSRVYSDRITEAMPH